MTRRTPAVLATLTLLLTGCITVATPKPNAPPSPPREFHKPMAKSIVVVVLENKNPQQALQQKFLGRLADAGAYFSNYFGVAHPSQPNYIAMVSGSIAGVRGDSPARLARPHLGRFLDSWTVYAEGYPSGNCDLRPTIGRYARKHEPFASFADVQDNQDFCRAHITGFERFAVDAANHRLPKFALVIPDMDHDAHDQPISVADRGLETNLAKVMGDPVFKRDVLLIISFDENADRPPYLHRRNNRIYTVFLGDSVKREKVNEIYNHYDLLRTIEEILDVKPMAEGDRNATIIGGIWR